jgi:hypothetical protein
MAKRDDKPTRSKGGSVVYRHQARPDDAGPAASLDSAWMETIENHIARHVAPADNVFHELVSDRVHIDVHFVAPGATHPYWLVFTTGMSARPMTVPEGADVTPYAELSILLPPTWQCGQDAFKDERWYWPVRWLKSLARLPHEYATWLGECHTIPNGDPPRPFVPDTALAGMMLLRSLTLPEEIHTIPLGDLTVDLFTLWPLTADELQYKLDRGSDALLAKLEAAEVSDIVDPARRSVVR